MQTEFGWHVIKVEEKRMSEPPPFDEVKEQLRNYVLRQKFETALTDAARQVPGRDHRPAGARPPAATEAAPAEAAPPARAARAARGRACAEEPAAETPN